MDYKSPEDFLKSLLDDEDQKKIITQISKNKEPEEILEYLLDNSETKGGNNNDWIWLWVKKRRGGWNCYI